MLRSIAAVNPRRAFAEDVRAGLTAWPRQLDCRYFYDAAGSALFEAICELPEYYLFRAEQSILEQEAASIVSRMARPPMIIELGCGNAHKTRLLLDAGVAGYTAVDICEVSLRHACQDLTQRYPSLPVQGLCGSYDDGLAALQREAGRGGAPRLVLWLGSNIGNLNRDDASAFLRQAAARLTPEDALLVGIDARKSPAVLEAAYNDAQGITARFNLNLLVRINHELGGNFDVHGFRHHAPYNDSEGRIEMYLVSQREQEVRIRDLEFTVRFAADEAIHTENSYKYSDAEVDALARAARLHREATWRDAQQRFMLTLFRPEA